MVPNMISPGKRINSMEKNHNERLLTDDIAHTSTEQSDTEIENRNFTDI